MLREEREYSVGRSLYYYHLQGDMTKCNLNISTAELKQAKKINIYKLPKQMTFISL